MPEPEETPAEEIPEPDPPKVEAPPTDDLKDLIKHQNELMAQQLEESRKARENSEEAAKHSKRIVEYIEHEPDDEGGDDGTGDPAPAGKPTDAKPEVTLVPPEPPPQPHAADPGAAAQPDKKKGWKGWW